MSRKDFVLYKFPTRKSNGVHVAESPNFGKFGYIRANRRIEVPKSCDLVSIRKSLDPVSGLLNLKATKILSWGICVCTLDDFGLTSFPTVVTISMAAEVVANLIFAVAEINHLDLQKGEHHD